MILKRTNDTNDLFHEPCRGIHTSDHPPNTVLPNSLHPSTLTGSLRHSLPMLPLTKTRSSLPYLYFSFKSNYIQFHLHHLNPVPSSPFPNNNSNHTGNHKHSHQHHNPEHPTPNLPPLTSFPPQHQHSRSPPPLTLSLWIVAMVVAVRTRTANGSETFVGGWWCDC